ncbi:uncharacterized protein LOC6500052 isoform X4 [Drosophila ananassae]|uniref:uncharacterized protein LOC6500052 isoform X4 n=1 Tax=Drosophila ananassae TaxID=7217 RepID=UPI001CFF8A44|nr:uncharacterized protein LOC6500052 isoform X4 [Drosophila ananassae]
MVFQYLLGSIPQAVPIIVISLLAFTTEVIFWILIALTRHDVEYTRNSAHWKALETRQGVYYPAEYRKFIRFHQECKTPKDLIRANQGDTAGPDFAEDSDGKKKKSGEETEFSGKKLAGHAVLTGAALGLAAAL